MIRLFIAVPVPEKIREIIQNGISKAKAADADIKWVEGDNLHLTLKFLGDQPESRVKDLVAALEQAVSTHTGLALEFTQVGFFPHRSRPRVIWMGMQGEIALINELAISIDQKLVPLGIAAENKRQWHLTLGRVRSERNLSDLVSQVDTIFSSLRGQEWVINSLILYQSTLTPQGPIYKELGQFNLKVT